MDLFSHLLAGTTEGKSRGNEDCFHENSMGNYDGEWLRQRGWALKDGHLTGWPWEGNQGDTGFHLRCKDLVQTTYKAGLYIQSQNLQQGDDAETSSPSSGSYHLLSFLQSCLDLSSMRQSPGFPPPANLPASEGETVAIPSATPPTTRAFP